MFRSALNQIGDWDLKLTSQVPQRVRDKLGRWGWFWITPRLNATTVTVQQVVDAAWYAGIARGPVWHRDDTITLKGWGLGWLLGDPDGVGPQTIPIIGSRDVSEVVGLLNAADVHNGLTVYPYPTDEMPWLMGTAYSAFSKVPSGFHQVISWASIAGGYDLDWIVEPSGFTWLAPGLELGDAFGPRVLCSTQLSAPDRLADGIVGLPAAIEWDETESDLVTRAQVHAPGDPSPNPAVTSSLTESLRPRRYLSSEPMDLTWWAERPDEAVTTPSASSRAYAARRSMTNRDLISVWVWGRPDIPRLCRPARAISVFGPRQKVYGSIVTAHQGGVGLPLDTRVEGIEFGFRPEEMDAWIAPNAAGLPTDIAYRLTEWAPPESPEVRLDVAAPVRPALATSSTRRRR
jgi:hypothetical protein